MNSEHFLIILTGTFVFGERQCQYSTQACLDNLHWKDCRCFCQENICDEFCCHSDDHFLCKSPPNEGILNFLDCDHSNVISQIVVKRCPNSWTEDETRTLCEEPAYKSINDVRLVKVNYSGVDIIFRNKYCATCHSELQFSNIPLFVNAFVCYQRLFDYIDTSNLTVKEAFLRLPPNVCGVHSLPTISKDRCTCVSPQHAGVTMQVLIDDTENATFNLECPRKVLTDLMTCDYNELYIDGDCRQIVQFDKCVDTLRFEYTVTGKEVNNTAFQDLVSYRFLDLLVRYQLPSSRLLKAEVKKMPGRHVDTNKDCVEIHIFATSTRPPGWNTTFYDGFLDLPCDHDLNCPITFLPQGHHLLKKECDLNFEVVGASRAWNIGPRISIVLFLLLTVV